MSSISSLVNGVPFLARSDMLLIRSSIVSEERSVDDGDDSSESVELIFLIAWRRPVEIFAVVDRAMVLLLVVVVVEK